MKILIYDCEIANAIATKDDRIIPNIRYCKGFHDFDGMGIAVVTAYDYHMDQYRIFFEDNLADFDALQEDAELVVGYNNVHFDDKLMAANGVEIAEGKSWDIFEAIQHASGEKFRKGRKLDDVTNVNLKLRKTGGGAAAPILWQQNKRGQVVDYGLTDTWLTKRILDLILETGGLIDPASGKHLDISIPAINP